jgi:hypothetical protein
MRPSPHRDADEVAGAFRAAVPAILMFAADGWIAAGFYFVWPSRTTWRAQM